MQEISSQAPCPCGSGKEYQNCCGKIHRNQVIHFPRGKRSNYRSLIEAAIADLLDYAKNYFPGWGSAALAKFTSLSQIGEISDKFLPVFWEWYVLNYRYYDDVSPLIDFYMVENDNHISDALRPVLHSLKDSYLSIYLVIWIENNTVAVRDVFTREEHIIEKDFGSITQFIEKGTLVLSRIIKIFNVSIITGNPVIINDEQRAYLYDEINSMRIAEGIDDFKLFLKEYAQHICGPVIDLSNGIKKNRIKSRTLLTSKIDSSKLINVLKRNNYFHLLDTSQSWTKFTWQGGESVFKRIYLGQDALVITTEHMQDLNMATQKLNIILENLGNYSGGAEWKDCFTCIKSEAVEELQTEITHDRYLDEWLGLPHPELDDLTPQEAMQDIRGLVLLQELLANLEMIELGARSRGEYCYPTTVIRKKLGLDREEVQRELLHPKAVAIKVDKNRRCQGISSYVTAYHWLNSDYNRVANYIFDIYTKQNLNTVRLAWLLYMWHEFSLIYQPQVHRIDTWVAALEHTLSKYQGHKPSYEGIARPFGIPIALVSRNAYMIVRHFKNFPLDLNREVSTYPEWEKLEYSEKLQSYEEVLHHLNLYNFSLGPDRDEIDEASRDYYDVVNTNGHFWDESHEKAYGKFFHYHWLFDYTGKTGSTIMNKFWEEHAQRFPPYLKTTALQIMMGYVGAYRITAAGLNSLFFEDCFTHEKYEVHGAFAKNMYENIVPGMIGITRLITMGDRWWLTDPMFIVLADMEELFEKNFYQLVGQLSYRDSSDLCYLKERGACLVKSYMISVDEFEKKMLNQINQPLRIEWFYTYIVNQELAIDLLRKNSKFCLLYRDPKRASFLWKRYYNQKNCQWGYLFVEGNCIYISTPPGKEVETFMKDIRRAFKCADIILAFRLYNACDNVLKIMEIKMVYDLAEYFDSNPELALVLFQQDNFQDEESEWNQGVFLLSLGSLMMEYLEKKQEILK